MSSSSNIETAVPADGSVTSGGASSTQCSTGGSSGNKCSGNLSLTPRFTQDEKEILYSLFHQHEEIIDIKYRKKQRSKYAVRDAWEQIVREFNSHPSVSAMRNVKQVQKFWLNARLRKQYPFRGNTAKSANNNDFNGHSIKHEPELHITDNDQAEQTDGFEEMEMESSVVNEIDDEDPIETGEQHQNEQSQQQQQMQPAQTANGIQSQQISVDQISAEKLTLNDLLQFKTSRPRDEIILQIKHPVDGTGRPPQITLPSPTRINLPTHTTHQHATMATITATGYNQQIISEIKPQQITLAQYQAQQQHQLQQQQLAQQQLAAAAVAAVQQQQQQQQQTQQQQSQMKMQIQPPSAATVQYGNSTPTFTCTTYSTLPVASAPVVTTNSPAINVSTATTMAAANVSNETFEEKLNYLKLKEAELRIKEEQVALEKKKIELNRAQEELKHMREIHRLKVEEMKMKIRILLEEEKELRKNRFTSSP